VLTVANSDVAGVNALLAQGWTVRHLAVAESAGNARSPYDEDRRHSLMVFVLSPPTPERQAENEKQRALAAIAAREALLARQRVLKPERAP